MVFLNSKGSLLGRARQNLSDLAEYSLLQKMVLPNLQGPQMRGECMDHATAVDSSE